MTLDEYRRTIASLSDDTALYGVGPFADLTEAEFMAQYTSSFPSAQHQPQHAYSDSSYMGEHVATPAGQAPDALDWEAKGAVTSVKKQRCGNCWTFSAAGSIEGAYAIKTKKLTNFSEQEFVDCIDTGCSGGWNFNALKFAVNHTVCTLEDFPCTGKGNGSICAAWKSSPCSKAKGALVSAILFLLFLEEGDRAVSHDAGSDAVPPLQIVAAELPARPLVLF